MGRSNKEYLNSRLSDESQKDEYELWLDTLEQDKLKDLDLHLNRLEKDNEQHEDMERG